MKKTTLMILILLIAAAVIVAGCTQAPTLNGQNPGANIPSVADAGANAATPPADTGTTPPANIPPPSTDNTSTPPTTPPATVKELKIEAYNFGFRVLNDVKINKGDTVKLTVTSAEGTHGFAMPDFNINLAPIAPGDVKTATFVADKSGTFTYFCNVPCGPGHSSMRGTLTVV